MKENLTDVKPPAATEIEAAILGSILIDNECFDKIIEMIRHPKIFYLKQHQLIYSTMVRMYNSGLPVDTITLNNELKREEILEECGGSVYLSKLSNNIPSSANSEYHAKILLEKWLLRAMIEISHNIAKKSYEGIEDAFDIHSASLSEFESILEQLDLKNEDRSLWEDFQDTINDIEDRYLGKKNCGLMCKTFPTLNKFTGGIRESDYIGILGDYKQGKSFLAQQIALDFAVYDKLPIGIFSLEMSKQSLYHRAFSLRTGIDYSKLRNPKDAGLTPDEFRNFMLKAEKIFKDTKIYIADSILDKNRIKAKMKLWKRKYGIKLFVVDYLNLVELNEKKERRDLEISALSRFFKNTSTELQVPIVILSQVNDKGISAEGKALMRDADFLISVKKPIEAGISNIRIGNRTFNFNEDHFLVTIENSRHGRNGFNFVCGFVNNNFVEIDVANSSEITQPNNDSDKKKSKLSEPVKSYYEPEENVI